MNADLKGVDREKIRALVDKYKKVNEERRISDFKVEFVKPKQPI